MDVIDVQLSVVYAYIPNMHWLEMQSMCNGHVVFWHLTAYFTALFMDDYASILSAHVIKLAAFVLISAEKVVLLWSDMF